MGRTSFNSKQNFLAGTSLKPQRPSRDLSLGDQLIETRLRIEQAKLAKLESETAEKTPTYTRYEDMPPPTPEDEARFDAEFEKLLGELFDEARGPDKGQTVQDWLTAQGAVIPDLPEWKVPLYLEKF